MRLRSFFPRVGTVAVVAVLALFASPLPASAAAYSISGTVLEGSTPLTGVDLTLSSSGAPFVDTTGAGGTFSFPTADDTVNYTLTPSKAGYSFSPPSLPFTAGSTSTTTADFIATLNRSSISGTITQPGPVPAAGVTVNLSGASTASVTTNASGVYSFPNLVDGSYTVTPSSGTAVFTPSSRSVTLTGANATGRDFTVPANRAVGKVFIDNNDNFAYDAGDAPAISVTVFVDPNANGTIDAGETQSANTNATGDYTLALAPGAYYLNVTNLPANSVATAPLGSVTVPFGGDVARNTAIRSTGSITGTVANDVDNNGSTSPSDVKAPNVNVYADVNGNSTRDVNEPVAATNASGQYILNGVPVGTRAVRFLPAVGITATTNQVTATVTQGATATAGGPLRLHYAASIRGTIRLNGQGVANAYIGIDRDGDGVTANEEVISAADGTYVIPSVPTGSFAVTPVVPTAFYSVVPTRRTVTVTAGVDTVGVSFDYARLASAHGYWLTASDGGIFSYGDSKFQGSLGGQRLNAPIVASAAKADGKGYWLVASDGGVFTFGEAGFFGSTGSLKLNSPIVAIAVKPDESGYWLIAADGGVFAFGRAGFSGSLGGQPLNAPIVGGVADPDNDGYLLVASDGGVFAFNATYRGSRGGQPLNAPIVGIGADPDGDGYWLAARDGGVFAYNARFYGSAGALPLNAPIQGMTVAPGGGYYLVATDGGVFSYPTGGGDFPLDYYGSRGGQPLNAPIAGIAAF